MSSFENRDCDPAFSRSCGTEADSAPDAVAAKTLPELRQQMDCADRALLAAFCRRMEISADIAQYKKEHGLPVYDPVREEQKLESVAAQSGAFSEYAKELYRVLMRLSRDYQNRQNGEEP